MNFIIFILAIIKLSQSQIPEKQKICDPSIRFCYGDENDNFIRNFLKNLSEEEKKKEMDIQIPHYSYVKMEIKKSKYDGLGIFLLEDLKQGQLIWKHNDKKMINSRILNHGLFFKNSLTLAHKKFKIQFDNQLNAFIYNCIYHFANIQTSFLRGDLMSLPWNEISPVLHLTENELQLLNNDSTNELYNSIIQNQIRIKDDYQIFVKINSSYFNNQGQGGLNIQNFIHNFCKNLFQFQNIKQILSIKSN